MPFLSLSSLLLRRCSHPSLLLFSPRSRSIYDPLNYTLDSTCIFFRAFNSMKETKVTRVLAIETSCDDTSVAILTSERHVIKLLTHHQTKVHELTGGIVPIVAAASHRKELPKLLRNVLEASQLTHEAIDLIAVTQGPGMVPCLSVGLIAAKNLAAVLNKPLIGVHHMEAHALVPRLTEHTPPSFPYLSLLVSGGHTLLVLTRDLGDHEVLGTTLDDAVGEAFDKVARYLGLSWLPTGGGAGAAVEQSAMQAPLTNDLRFSVPFQQGRHQPSRAFDFSYSGLKAQVKRYIDANPPQTPLDQSLIAAAFQKAAFTHLLDRVQHAFSKFPDVSTLVVSGGVAANLQLRQLLQQHLEPSRHLVFPPIHLCSDNAAMIGWVALEYIRRGYHGMQMGRDIDLDAIPTWSLNDLKQIAPSEGS